jgi:hypothetical protein
MKRDLFLQIVKDMEDNCDYFVQKPNAAKVLGFSALQKVTAAIRMLSYGTAADSVDEYLRMAESTAIESLKYFCKTVIKVYGEQYLRSVCQVITCLVRIPVDDKVNSGCSSIKNGLEDRRSIQNVYIIERTREPKKRMPDPKVL